MNNPFSRNIVLLLFVVNIGLYAQWTKIYNPAFSRVRSISIVDSKLLAGTTNSIYMSDDWGQNWIQSDSGFGSKFYPNRAYSFTSDGNKIFAGTYNGIFSSSDEGKSWVKVLNATYVPEIMVLDSVIIAATNGGYRSTDSGNSWLKISDKFLFSLTANNNKIYAAAGFDGVLVSTDFGQTWTQISSCSQIDNELEVGISEITVSGDNIIIGTTNNGLYVSKDNGTSWEKILPDKPKLATSDLEVSGRNVYAGTYRDGFFFSSDNGNSWTQRNSDLPDLSIYDVATKGNDIFISLWWGGIYHSSDNGINWNELNSGLPLLYSAITAIARKGDYIYAGVKDRGLFISTDKGLSWIREVSELAFQGHMYSIVCKDSNVLIGTQNGIYLSSDKGKNWESKNKGIEFGYAKTLEIVDSILFAGNNQGIYLSTNNGEDWVQTYTSYTNNSEAYFLYYGNGFLFAGIDGLLRSSDYGRTWVHKESEIESNNLKVYAMTSIDSSFFVGNNYGVNISSDYGETWELSTKSGVNHPYIPFLIQSNGILYAADATRIYQSANMGQSWSTVLRNDNNGNSIRVDHYCLMIYDSYIYIGTENGIWSCPLSNLILDVKDNSIRTSLSYVLSQNYPNPFNPTTQINFSIPASGHVELYIYDVLGREITKLVDKYQPAGYYSVEFNASKLSSGIYFYKLKSGSFVQTKKMLLLK